MVYRLQEQHLLVVYLLVYRYLVVYQTTSSSSSCFTLCRLGFWQQKTLRCGGGWKSKRCVCARVQQHPCGLTRVCSSSLQGGEQGREGGDATNGRSRRGRLRRGLEGLRKECIPFRKRWGCSSRGRPHWGNDVGGRAPAHPLGTETPPDCGGTARIPSTARVPPHPPHPSSLASKRASTHTRLGRREGEGGRGRYLIEEL